MDKYKALEKAINEATKVFGADPAYFGEEGKKEIDKQLRILGFKSDDFQ